MSAFGTEGVTPHQMQIIGINEEKHPIIKEAFNLFSQYIQDEFLESCEFSDIRKLSIYEMIKTAIPKGLNILPFDSFFSTKTISISEENTIFLNSKMFNTMPLKERIENIMHEFMFIAGLRDHEYNVMCDPDQYSLCKIAKAFAEYVSNTSEFGAANTRLLDKQSKKIVTEIDDPIIVQAIKIFRNHVKDPEFLTSISNKPEGEFTNYNRTTNKFDKVPGQQIADILKNANLDFSVETYFSPLPRVIGMDGGDEKKIYINSLRLLWRPLSLMDRIKNLMHEFMHIQGYSHKGNKPCDEEKNENWNTVPWKVMRIFGDFIATTQDYQDAALLLEKKAS